MMPPNHRDQPSSRLDRSLDNRVRAARLALFWESLWPSLWPPLGIAGSFIALVLFDALPMLPGWAHVIVLVGFAAAFGVALVRALLNLAVPGWESAERRIEAKSELVHRPLTLARDTLAAGDGDSDSRALWEAHRRRTLAEIDRLKVGWPRSSLPRRDRRALRAALVLTLLVAGVFAHGDVRGSFERAFAPSFTAGEAARLASLDVWITPPEYTGLPPRFMRFGDGQSDGDRPATLAGGGALANEILEVPAGSALLAQLHGGSGVPQLRAAGSDTPFETIDGDSFQISAKIEKAGRMEVVQSGAAVADWTIAVVADQPPTIAFARQPSATPRATLRLEFTAADDFGLSGVSATIRRSQVYKPDTPGTVGSETAERPGGAAEDKTAVEEIRLDLPLPGRSPRMAEGTSYHDLTSHIWAGLPVSIQLTTWDALEQKATSKAVETVLPERIFNNPVARALIAARKTLTLHPEQRLLVAGTVRRIKNQPHDYQHDIVVYLSLKSIQDRLLHDREGERVAEVQQLLWDTALRVEDGEMSLAERSLRDIQRQLQDALNRDAGDDEINELIDKLQQALDQFFQRLAEDMRRHPEKYQGALPPDPNMTTIERQDLQQLLDRIRELAETGSRDAARQLLAELQEMLENLHMGDMRQAGSGQTPADQMMRTLEELAKRQQELMDRTFRKSQQDSQQSRPGEGQQGAMPPNMAGEAADQEALRRMLGEIMRGLGEMTGQIPGGLGEAELSMRDAEGALKQGRAGEAVQSQGEALENLRSGMQQAAQQLMRQFGQQFGFAPFGQSQRPDNSNRDPLGRTIDGNGRSWGSDVEVPGEGELQRARQILDELRRRAGESFRPNLELDYIDRLLRRF